MVDIYGDIEKKRIQEGLAKIFKEFRMNGVAKEIKAGRNVVNNVEYGFKNIHSQYFGPKINNVTGAFYPQSLKNSVTEKKVFDLLNNLLVSVGYRKISRTILSALKRKDRAFEKRVSKQYGKKFYRVIT